MFTEELEERERDKWNDRKAADWTVEGCIAVSYDIDNFRRYAAPLLLLHLDLVRFVRFH